jgi:hypothetical protein
MVVPVNVCVVDVNRAGQADTLYVSLLQFYWR